AEDGVRGGHVTGVQTCALPISVLTGLAIASLGEFGARALRAVEVVNKVVFAIIRMIIRTAPLGALGGMAFTIGSYGLASLSNLEIGRASGRERVGPRAGAAGGK